VDHLSVAVQDWRLPQWAPGHFTVPFSHDEAVALTGVRRRPARGQVELITPPSTVAVLAAGYSPQIDATALRGWRA
jgi:hypothetical protein